MASLRVRLARKSSRIANLFEDTDASHCEENDRRVTRTGGLERLENSFEKTFSRSNRIKRRSLRTSTRTILDNTILFRDCVERARESSTKTPLTVTRINY